MLESIGHSKLQSENNIGPLWKAMVIVEEQQESK
jgi:hypothetical protein